MNTILFFQTIKQRQKEEDTVVRPLTNTSELQKTF